MQEGVASHTARSVAARRLSFERVITDFGDPGADLALSTDVAAGLVPSEGRMHSYIRARTAFFDRAVVGALSQGIEQIVVGAAGYDGRSLRYAKPGVRWFEVDHPATQADKRERLARLGIDTSHVRFIAADFTTDPIARPLAEAGLDASQPALFLYEGIAVYLSKEVNESVLAQFRSVTTAGSLLAISVSLTRGEREPDSRAGFRARVAALGEPAQSILEPAEARDLLARAGWQVTGPATGEDLARHDRLQAAGLLTARASGPAYPSAAPVPASLSSPSSASPAAPASASPRSPSATSASAPVPASIARRPPPRGRPRSASAPARDSPSAPASAAALPLPALLSRAVVAFTIEADNEAEHRLPHSTTGHGLSSGASPDAPWMISLAMWASSLRFIPDGGVTVTRLRDLARTGSNLAGLRRWRYVTFDPEPTRGKQPSPSAMVFLTPQGKVARDGWAPIGEVVEERWRERFGATTVAGLRSALTGVAAQLPAGLPDCLPILGYGLFSRVPEDLPEPAEVPSLAELPLWALLSRVLLAFATEFEDAARLSLAIAANVLRVITADGVRSRDIPELSGVSKEAVAMAMGILTNRGLATEGTNPSGGRWRTVRLTPAGLLAQGTYHELVADIEDAWRSRFGADQLTALRLALEQLPADGLLEGIDPYPDGWRAPQDPPTVLPHYPMVLHRGGYPDGS
ncbi:MAG TPA: SAM-dependent methyltransferase [Trebonia sp.]|nr:SAM-dependent methyltransferase [Trebonia sp.]